MSLMARIRALSRLTEHETGSRIPREQCHRSQNEGYWRKQRRNSSSTCCNLSPLVQLRTCPDEILGHVRKFSGALNLLQHAGPPHPPRRVARAAGTRSASPAERPFPGNSSAAFLCLKKMSSLSSSKPDFRGYVTLSYASKPKPKQVHRDKTAKARRSSNNSRQLCISIFLQYGQRCEAEKGRICGLISSS